MIDVDVEGAPRKKLKSSLNARPVYQRRYGIRVAAFNRQADKAAISQSLDLNGRTLNDLSGQADQKSLPRQPRLDGFGLVHHGNGHLIKAQRKLGLVFCSMMASEPHLASRSRPSAASDVLVEITVERPEVIIFENSRISCERRIGHPDARSAVKLDAKIEHIGF